MRGSTNASSPFDFVGSVAPFVRFVFFVPSVLSTLQGTHYALASLAT